MTDANTANRPFPAGVGPLAQDHAGGRSSAARAARQSSATSPTGSACGRTGIHAPRAPGRQSVGGFGSGPGLRLGRAVQPGM